MQGFLIVRMKLASLSIACSFPTVAKICTSKSFETAPESAKSSAYWKLNVLEAASN